MTHDRNFKNLILEYPHLTLAFFVAEEAADGLVGAEVLPVRQEQLKNRLGDRFRDLDCPLLVQWPDGLIMVTTADPGAQSAQHMRNTAGAVLRGVSGVARGEWCCEGITPATPVYGRSLVRTADPTAARP